MEEDNVASEYIFCCDWGTSSLRVRLVRIHDHVIMDEETTDQGIAAVREQFIKQKGNRVEFYLNLLEAIIQVIIKRVGAGAQEASVILSGMASSSHGILELPYARLPFSIRGEQVIGHIIEPSGSCCRQVFLFSGVRDDEDVMRGEEAQIVGIGAIAHSLDISGNILALLPGTHSKHVHILNGSIRRIETYLTGELFSLLSQHGILKDAVQTPVFPLGSQEWNAFEQGIASSGTTPLLHSLFNVRTNQLFQKFNKQENHAFLSGLLIGHELHSLSSDAGTQIILCSESNLYHYYKRALGHLGLQKASHLIDPGEARKTTVEGQLIMYDEYLKKHIRQRNAHV